MKMKIKRKMEIKMIKIVQIIKRIVKELDQKMEMSLVLAL